MEKKLRMVVCPKCGTLHDLHYITKVKIEKKKITKFECKHCGMVQTVYSNIISIGGINMENLDKSNVKIRTTNTIINYLNVVGYKGNGVLEILDMIKTRIKSQEEN